jgi:hypothetical protein
MSAVADGPEDGGHGRRAGRLHKQRHHSTQMVPLSNVTVAFASRVKGDPARAFRPSVITAHAEKEEAYSTCDGVRRSQRALTDQKSHASSLCSPPSTSLPAASSVNATPVTAPPSSQVPRRDRSQRPCRSRHSPRHGQLGHPQDATDPQLAPRKAALACPSDADQYLLAQPGRAFLRTHYCAQNQARHPSQRRCLAGRHHVLP